MGRLEGLARIGADSPRVLILGSFPSVRSLELGQYYAHDRNHFWVILGLILGFEPSAPYAERIGRLERAGIALWDTIASCEREGSLDQAIRGELPNPIAELVAARSAIERIGLNGGKAADAFLDFLAPELRVGAGRHLAIAESRTWVPGRNILIARLPSTSPVPTQAYRGAADKLPAWSAFISPSL